LIKHTPSLFYATKSDLRIKYIEDRISPGGMLYFSKEWPLLREFKSGVYQKLKLRWEMLPHTEMSLMISL